MKLTEDMEIIPCGTSILIEIIPVEETYEGSMIQRPKSETKREHGGRDVGKIVSFGPYCYKDFKTDAKGWGAVEGDIVEFARYDGKIPRIAELFDKYKNYRLINDNDIKAVYK